jgi:hypothetical protein
MDYDPHPRVRPADNLCAGVTVTKDLACIAVVGNEKREVFMYTYNDGRAFRSVPYFNRWRPEFVLHDDDLEDGAFGRALMDICEKFGILAIGYDSAQTKILDRRAIAFEKDSVDVEIALSLMNDERLFSQDSAKEYMWNSLPTECSVRTDDRGVKYEVIERVFPHGDLVARGRYDAVQALAYAFAARFEHRLRVEQTTERRQQQKQQQIVEGQRKQITEYWESLPAEALVLVDDSRLPGMRTLSMADALPLLKSEQVKFYSLQPGWQHLAWTGYKPIDIVDERGVVIETVRFDR